MKIFILLLLIVNLISSVFDKAYVFGEYSQDDKENKTLFSKVSLEKTIWLGDDSFLFLNGIAQLDYDYNKEDAQTDLLMRKAYYDAYFLLEIVNIRMGRDIKTFDFAKTYSILDFLASSSSVHDVEDRTLSIKPLDGITFTIINPYAKNGMSQFLSFYAYVDDAFDELGRKNKKYLFEATQSGDSFYQ